MNELHVTDIDVNCCFVSTCRLFPQDRWSRHSFRLTVQSYVAVAFDAYIQWFYFPSWRDCLKLDESSVHTCTINAALGKLIQNHFDTFYVSLKAFLIKNK